MCSDRLRILTAALLLVSTAVAQSRIEPEEAMALACPDTKICKRTVVLTPAQRDAIATKSGEKRPGPFVWCYEARKNGELLATGYLDAHVVRTKKQVLLIVVDEQGDKRGAVRRVEVLAFAEPREYRPAGRFYAQFRGMKLSKRLREGKAIQRVTGATLTTRATTAAVRRALAVHRVLGQKQQ